MPQTKEPGTTRAYVITYYKRGQDEPVKTRRVENLHLSSVQVMTDEWREHTNGYATIEPVADEPAPTEGVLDHKGQRHLVSIERECHDFWTAAGELKAACVCGWWDHQSYSARGEDYARLRLQYRAADHVPQLRAV
jgi:hypothetical protein